MSSGSCGHRLTPSVFLSLEMPAVNHSRSCPILGGAYYYPGEDFTVWRVQFEALCERQQWPDSVAFAYTRNSATEAVMDIPHCGPESLAQFLDAYETRFQLFEDLRILRIRGEELPPEPRSRSPSGRRRQSLLKPRSTRGTPVPSTLQPSPPPGINGRVIQVETPEGRIEEVTLPPNVEELRRRVLFERTRALLREKEDGTQTHSAEDVRNRILFEQTRPCPLGSEDSNLPCPKEVGGLTEKQVVEPEDEQDFPSGQ